MATPSSPDAKSPAPTGAKAPRRSGLGRGLSALIPDTDVPDAALRDLPIDTIKANDFQPRTEFDDEALRALAASIAEVGVLQPILVRPAGPGTDGGYELIAGERRWRAAKLAGLAQVPAIVREVDDRLSLAQALVENLQREDLSAIEEAVAYQQLIDDFQLSMDDVADRVGKSRPAVANTVRLLQLPASIQAQVRDRTLSAGHARALLAVEDPEQQQQLVAEVLRDHLSVRALEARVRALGQAPEGAGSDDIPAPTPRRGAARGAGVLEVEERLREHLATKVDVTINARGRGTISIHFAGEDDLSRLYALLALAPSGDEP